MGEAIKGSRQHWVIGTKFGHKYLPDFAREQLWSNKDVLKQLEDSLKALQTDYVDVYMFHSCKNNLQDDALWTMLEKQKAAGKIRHLGLSLKKVITDNVFQTGYAAEHGIEVIELLYNRLDRSPEDKVFSICMENDIGVLARVPLASGLLSGKYKPGAQFIKSDIRSMQDRSVLDARLALVEEIHKNEVPAGTDMAESYIPVTIITRIAYKPLKIYIICSFLLDFSSNTRYNYNVYWRCSYDISICEKQAEWYYICL